MSLYAQFETDKVFEQDGIYLEYGPASNGKPIRFKVARAGGANKGYSKSLEKFSRMHRVALENETLSNDVAKKALLDVFCTSVLLGWENVEDRDGKPLPFTRDNAIALMTDLPDLYDNIQKQASKAALFRKAEMEDDLKNSPASSGMASQPGE